jgi:DNA-binding transcriptional LysR family regulator
MNIHHLELFYYVARHGGIMPAVRNIPYGIQQPAVSAQVAQLEAYLGETLFRRRPFALTTAGEKLYKFIEPFFSNLETMAKELQGGQARQIRIGASTLVLRDHLPALLQGMRKKFPGLKVSLRDGYPARLEELLVKDEIDLAITLIEKKSMPGIRTLVLLQLPMILLVENDSRITSAEELWKRDKIDVPLICLPAGEALSKSFLLQLDRLGVEWFPSIEASSVDLIETYVANGLGVGVSVAVPGKTLSPQVRALPLKGFKPANLGAMWQGRRTMLVDALIESLEGAAEALRRAGENKISNLKKTDFPKLSGRPSAHS